ncbi:MAG: hypothetical protein R3A44_08920 [Caldilineaceae bacterium]
MNESAKQPLSAEELNAIARAVTKVLDNQYAGNVQIRNLHIANLTQISEPERRNLLLRATPGQPARWSSPQPDCEESGGRVPGIAGAIVRQ